MPALIVIELKVKNADKLKEYSAKTPEILKRFNGQLVHKGKAERVHTSTAAFVGYDTVVVFQFPSKEEALGWYNSPEYQALLRLRDEAMDSVFQLVA